MDDLHCPVGLVDIHQDGHLDLAGGDHADIDARIVQGLKHFGRHAGVVDHARSHDGDLGNFVVDIHMVELKEIPVLIQELLAALHILNAHGEADILSIIAADGLEYEVHIDPLLGQQGEDLESDARLVGQPHHGHTGHIFIAGYAADVQFFHGFCNLLDFGAGLAGKAGEDLQIDAVALGHLHRTVVEHLGAQVLHNRSVEMAKRYGVNLEVLSSFSGKPGTKVKEVAKTMEKLHVSGVACDKNVARVAVVGLADEPGIAFKIFSLLAKERINVDLILQSIGRNNTKDISFTVSIQDVERCKQLLDEHRDFLQFDHVDVNDKIAKVSIVGAGMVHNPGVAAKMFEALYNAGINISMISTSEIKVSVLVDINEADRAVQVIHDRFFHEFGGN